MNEQNLVSNSERTPSERKKLASKAGKRSGEVRKQKKRIQEALNKALAGKFEIDDKSVDGYAALAIRLIKKALDGDVQAFKEIRDTIGEKPKDTVEIESNDITGIKIKFVDKSAKGTKKDKDPKIVGDYTPPTNTEE